MTCREFSELLIDYHSGELTPNECVRFETHLTRCARCVVYLRSCEETIRLAAGAFRGPDEGMIENVPDALVRAVLAARRQIRR